MIHKFNYVVNFLAPSESRLMKYMFHSIPFHITFNNKIGKRQKAKENKNDRGMGKGTKLGNSTKSIDACDEVFPTGYVVFTPIRTINVIIFCLAS